MHFYDIDWEQWQPNMIATLLFVVRDEEVLLIHKKTGMGKGKINGPGGKVEEDEKPIDGAVRECQEEITITPTNPRARGVMNFQFVDGLQLRCFIFSATEFEGTPSETVEAKPFWAPIDAIPFDKMWEDDQYWLPALLKGHDVEGFFLFDDERMVDMKLATIPA